MFIIYIFMNVYIHDTIVHSDMGINPHTGEYVGAQLAITNTEVCAKDRIATCLGQRHCFEFEKATHSLKVLKRWSVGLLGCRFGILYNDSSKEHANTENEPSSPQEPSKTK
jgi:hypothetical protein